MKKINKIICLLFGHRQWKYGRFWQQISFDKGGWFDGRCCDRCGKIME